MAPDSGVQTGAVEGTAQVFSLILLTLDAWKRMQMRELAEEGMEAGTQKNNMSEVCVLYYFGGATRIGTHRAATPVGAALRAVPAQGRISLGATRIGTHSAATPSGAALRAVPAQGRFGLLPYAYFISGWRRPTWTTRR